MKVSSPLALLRRSPAPADSYGLRDLSDRLAQFRPPAKSDDLLAAEANLASSKAVLQAHMAELRALCIENRAQENSGTFNREIAARIRSMERATPQLERDCAIARAAVEDLSAPWRRAYSNSLLEQMNELRAALSPLCDDLGYALRVLGELSNRAAQNGVGVPWIARTAGDPLLLIERLRIILDMDKKLMQAVDQ